MNGIIAFITSKSLWGNFNNRRYFHTIIRKNISHCARAKKPKSKFFGYLAPFCKLKVTYSGRSELKTLTNIDRDFSMSVDNFSKPATACYTLMSF